jgi:hypothetical protein
MSPTRPGLAGAYWLIDEIAFAQRADKRVAGETFQLWKLTVNSDHTATEDDDVHPKPVAWFGNAVEFALAALAPPGTVVLTHCAHGRNRGPLAHLRDPARPGLAAS